MISKLKNRGGKRVTKIKISMTIDEEVFEDFKEYCKQNGMKISTKVELLMKDGIKNSSLRKFIE
jgi:antitoxin component of RelBE/YafQ-DinJ toxin-antitoxin module